MPRPRNPLNEPGRSRTAKWRKKLFEGGGFETDAVDSAIAAAIALYLRDALAANSAKDLGRIEAFEKIAASILLDDDRFKSERDQGKKAVAYESAVRRIHGRLRRDDIEELAAIPAYRAPLSKPSSLPITHGM